MGSIVADSFVSLTPLTHETVIFGRNSYRPEGEATEVQYFAASTEAQSTQKVSICAIVKETIVLSYCVPHQNGYNDMIF